MSNFKVAVLGDFMQDVYWIGEATRISPEAPIPVVKIKETRSFPGGAGNVAENLEALGVKAVWYIAVGIKPKKNRLMVGDHQLARWDENDKCWPIVGTLKFEECDALVVADYDKGGINDEMIEAIRQFKGPIFVDTKRDPSVWSGVATVVFPNTKEYEQYKDQYQTFDGLVCWKRGEMGLALYIDMLARYDPKFVLSPSQVRFVKSVNGAGDSVIAAFVYKWLAQMQEYSYYEEGRDYEELLDFANAAAAVACEHSMTYAPTLKEVEARFYQ